MTPFTHWTDLIGTGIEAAGVTVIALGALATTGSFLARLKTRGLDEAYRTFRRGLARSILLGLEFLVAGDIIRTVVVEPTWRNVGALAVIVAIRTFMSFSLEVEISGRWPWQRGGTRQT